MGEACAAFVLMFIVCTVALDKKGDPSKIPLVMVRCSLRPASISFVGKPARQRRLSDRCVGSTVTCAPPRNKPSTVLQALVIPVLIFLVGPVSSMCINPARAFGPALASGFWEHHWLWWTAPFVGGFAAVVPYKLLSDLEEKDA